MSTARPYEEQEDPGGMPATTTAPVTATPVAFALVTPTLATSPARRCWSPRPASGRHLHWPTLRRNAASRCITIQVGENLAKPSATAVARYSRSRAISRSLPMSSASSRTAHSTSAGSMAWSTMPPRPRALAELTEAHCDADLNARSVLTASRKAMPWLKRQGGFIVLVDRGTQWRRRRRRPLWLGSSPPAAWPRNWSARLNAVAPGTIATAFHERYSTEEQAMVATIPQGRAGTPQDCVVAVPLHRPVEGYITGHEVNGGQLMP